MTHQSALTLIDPQNGNLAFKLFTFSDNSYFDYLQRNNYYSLIWVTEGSGKLIADFSEYSYLPNTLFAFAPYQPFIFMADKKMKGVALQFHPDFFCIHKHQHEVACNGVLFNNVYNPPFVLVDESKANTFNVMLEHIKVEMQNRALAQYELLVSYLKIFLINASRLKTSQQVDAQLSVADSEEPFILQKLKNYLEQHYKTKHAVSNYADMLNISPKALSKISKTHFNKTITKLIAERIVIEAKRELYLTNKTIKEIAYELGYNDESYFSRFFKINAEVSPQLYRETVGFNKMGLS